MLRRLAVILFVLAGALAMLKLGGRSFTDDSDHMCWYRSGQILLRGGNPYLETPFPHNYVYPPLWAFLMVPASLLHPVVYSIAWCILLGACWCWSWRSVMHLLAPNGRVLHWSVMVIPNLMLFRFIHTGWAMGQLSLLLSVWALRAFRLERAGRDRAAAWLVGLVGALKIFPTFLVLMFVRPFRPRALLRTVCAATALTLLPCMGLGVHQYVNLVKNALGASAQSVGVQGLRGDRFSPVATIWRLSGHTAGMSLRLTQVAFLVVCTVLFLALRRPREDRFRDNLWMGLMLTTMVIVTPMVQENYLTFLLLPIAASLDLAFQLPRGHSVRVVLLGGVAAAAVLFNIYSPLVVGRRLSDIMMTWGLLDSGLLILWTTQAWSLWHLSREATGALTAAETSVRENR